jgi:hypothetical protein
MVAIASLKEAVGKKHSLCNPQSSGSTSVRTASGSDRIKTHLSRTTKVFKCIV